MICYRDRTFCGFYKNCLIGDLCLSALTQEEIEQASRIGLPIAQYIDRPDCFKENNNDGS